MILLFVVFHFYVCFLDELFSFVKCLLFEMQF